MPRRGHIRLTGEDADEKDQVIAGRSWQVRYLGSSEIRSSDGRGKGCTNEAVREIYRRYSTKSTVRNLAKRELFVSANCVSLYAPAEEAVIFRYQTINITFCNTSDENHCAFAFVVREARSFRAHVVHCENSTQSNDICMAMHEAFTVRSALYQAKRMDRAGWGNGLLTSGQEKAVTRPRNGELRTEKGKENGDNGTDSNNNFGEFACAVVFGDKADSWNESENNSNANNQPRYTERLLIGDHADRSKLYGQNGGGFSLAKMLLKDSLNRSRSQSLPHEVANPWPSSNGEWGCYQGSQNALSTDVDDDFSLLARERSSSMNLLTAEMR